MAQVRISYNAWDANLAVIPAAQKPEVWFRPLQTSFANGLITDRDVKGTLGVEGNGAVWVESAPGLLYVPYMRWLVDPSQDEPGKRAYGYTEWPAIFPGRGGDISELQPAVGIAGVLVGFGPPPIQFSNLVYLDITGPQIDVWGPTGGNV